MVASGPVFGGSLSSVTATTDARFPLSSYWTRILRCPWACSPHRSCSGAAAAAPGDLVPTLEVEHGEELAGYNLNIKNKQNESNGSRLPSSNEVKEFGGLGGEVGRNLTHEKALPDIKEATQPDNALRTRAPVDDPVPSDLTQERQLTVPGGRRERHRQGNGVRPGPETGVQSFVLYTRHYSHE